MKELIENLKKFFGCDCTSKEARLFDIATKRANSMYTIIKKGDKAIVYLNGKPASVEWEEHPEAILYRLRDMYVEECMKCG